MEHGIDDGIDRDEILPKDGFTPLDQEFRQGNLGAFVAKAPEGDNVGDMSGVNAWSFRAAQNLSSVRARTKAALGMRGVH
jgi:hypothetical protein